MIDLDPAFRDRITRVFGDEGRAWLDDLPAILRTYADRWGLTIEKPYPLSYNYVAPATREDGTRVVLKAGVPREQIACEIAALQHWAGDGAVRVLESDPPGGVFLLEHVAPGSPIIEIDDAEATQIAARLMRRIWRPAPVNHAFPTLADWGTAFADLRARHGGTSGPLPQALFDRGAALYFDLVRSQAEPVVLHGDLHHWNILSAEREPWLVIDPHGVVGEPAFEVGAWMRNPAAFEDGPFKARSLLLQPDVRGILARRLDIFGEELQVDRDRVRDWGIAFAVLSACWSEESTHAESWHQAMTVADHLSTL